MFNSSVLEVAIGLVFLYLSMSMVCSALTEYYSTLLSRRAKHLRDSLFLLFNKDDPKGLAFLLDFYTHPLVSGLAPEKARIVSSPGTEIPLGLPWYQRLVVMPLRGVAWLLGLIAGWAASFTAAVRWVGNAVRDPYGVGGVVNGLKQELAKASKATPNYIPDRAFADAVFAVLANDASATRRLRIELTERLTQLEQEFRALDHGQTTADLMSQLVILSQKFRMNIDDSTAPEKLMSDVEEAFSSMADTVLPGVPSDDEFDLRLMLSESDLNWIPQQSKKLIIIASVNKLLHFRVFNSKGDQVVDENEDALKDQAQRIEDLKSLLGPLRASRKLTPIRKRRVLSAVKSIVGLTPDDPSLQRVQELLNRDPAVPASTDASPAPPQGDASGGTVPNQPAGADVLRTAMIHEAGAFPEGLAKQELLDLLGGSGRVGTVLSLWRTKGGTAGYIQWLRTSFNANDAARRQDVNRALDLIEQARDSVVKAGPVLPSDESVRDHVWGAIETSIQRLRGAVATLPEVQLRTPLAAKLEELLKVVQDERKKEPSSLASARATVKHVVTNLSGTLDGLKNQSGWSNVAAWVEREAKSLLAAETDLITLAKLRDAVNALPESQVRATLLSLMDEVGDDLDKVKQNVQVWFNDSMDRVSGWYKRNTQLILVLIAFVVTTLLNADTLQLGQRLYQDTSLRTVVVARASNVKPPLEEAAAPPAGGGNKIESSRDIMDRMLQQLGMPLGWSEDDFKQLGISSDVRQGFGLFKSFDSGQGPIWSIPRTVVQDMRRIGRVAWNLLQGLFTTSFGLRKLMGLALTAIAASMGAPFWFDLLNKLVNVRSAGTRPPKSSEQPTERALPA